MREDMERKRSCIQSLITLDVDLTGRGLIPFFSSEIIPLTTRVV